MVTNLARIAAVVEFCPPRLGSDRRIFELLSRLNKKRDVHFIVFPPGRAFLGRIPFPHEHQRDNSRILRENVTAHYVSVPGFLQKNWANFFLGSILTALLVFPKALRKIKDINPDVIVVNYPSVYTGLFGFLTGRLLARKVVVEFNDIIAYYTLGLLEDQSESGTTAKKGPLRLILLRLFVSTQNFIIKHAHVVTALTTYTSQYAERLGIRDDVHLIPDGVDTGLFDPARVSFSSRNKIRRKYKIKKGEKIIVYIGRLEKWAGADLVVKCAAQLGFLDAKFLLVGEGELKEGLTSPNVILCGRIPHESVVDYLSAADLVLVPMQQDALGQSASPLKLFEAMAMAKPVIASDTQGIRDVIKNGENGFLLRSNEAEWTATIRHVLDNPRLAAQIGQNARKTVEIGYNWCTLVTQFEKLLYSSKP